MSPVQNWQNGGKLEQLKAMDRIFQGAKCDNVPQPGVRGKHVVVAVTLFSPFHILICVPVAAPILFSFLLIVWLRVTDIREHRSAVYVGMVMVVCII